MFEQIQQAISTTVRESWLPLHMPNETGNSSASKTDCDSLTAKSLWEEHYWYSSHSQILIKTK